MENHNTTPLPDASTPVLLTKDLADIAFRNAETQEKLRGIDLDTQKTENESSRVNIDKVNTLRHLIESYTIDEDRQVAGCEIVWKNTFNEGEIMTLKDKMFELIKKF